MNLDLPGELWMLSIPANEEGPGTWVRSIDSIPDNLYLVCCSEAEAIEAAEYQNEQYLLDGTECYPVRVK